MTALEYARAYRGRLYVFNPHDTRWTALQDALVTCNAPGCEGGCTRMHRTVKATIAESDRAWYAHGGSRD